MKASSSAIAKIILTEEPVFVNAKFIQCARRMGSGGFGLRRLGALKQTGTERGGAGASIFRTTKNFSLI